MQLDKYDCCEGVQLDFHLDREHRNTCNNICSLHFDKVKTDPDFVQWAVDQAAIFFQSLITSQWLSSLKSTEIFYNFTRGDFIFIFPSDFVLFSSCLNFFRTRTRG